MLGQELVVSTKGRGLYLITPQVEELIENVSLPNIGLLHLFLCHTSASLVLQENADPSARRDLERFLNQLIPEGQSWHEHTHEGPDDTTSHMKSAITQSHLMLPIRRHKLAIGQWQGIYLWEHRLQPHRRQLLLTIVD